MRQPERKSVVQKERFQGCMVCGKPIAYQKQAVRRTCVICGGEQISNMVCSEGHFVCDACHGTGYVRAAVFLRESREKNPMQLFEQVAALPEIHLHGPEHHVLVPCVLLTAFRNAGGSLNIEDALIEAIHRGRKIPGGTCGYWGVCGAAAGAGIYASILLGTTPLQRETWSVPQTLVAECLRHLAQVGGPRCCKRACRICIEVGAQFAEEQFGVHMPTDAEPCSYFSLNRECIHKDCPYFPIGIHH